MKRGLQGPVFVSRCIASKFRPRRACLLAFGGSSFCGQTRFRAFKMHISSQVGLRGSSDPGRKRPLVATGREQSIRGLHPYPRGRRHRCERGRPDYPPRRHPAPLGVGHVRGRDQRTRQPSCSGWLAFEVDPRAKPSKSAAVAPGRVRRTEWKPPRVAFSSPMGMPVIGHTTEMNEWAVLGNAQAALDVSLWIVTAASLPGRIAHWPPSPWREARI